MQSEQLRIEHPHTLKLGIVKFGRCRRLRCSRFRRPRRRCVGTVAIRVLPHCEPAWAFRIRSPGQQPRILSFCFLCSPPPLPPPQFTKQNPHRSSHPVSPALPTSNASPPSSRNYFPVLWNRIPFAVVLPLPHPLSLSLFSFHLSTNPYAHPSPLYSSSLRFPFHTQLYTSPHRYRYHARSVSVPFKSSDRFRLSYSTENRKSSRPLFPPPTNTRAHTHVSNRPDFVLSFLQLTSPPFVVQPFVPSRPAHTVILFHYFLIERLLVLFDCSFYVL